MNIDKSLHHYRDRLLIVILNGSDTFPSSIDQKENGQAPTSIQSKGLITALYRRNFKPKVFTDIKTPAKQS